MPKCRCGFSFEAPHTNPDTIFNATQALTAARDYITQVGWARHGYHNTVEEVCAVGALQTVVLGEPCATHHTHGNQRLIRKAMHHLTHVGYRHFQIENAHPFEMNDVFAHGARDVLTWFDEAIRYTHGIERDEYAAIVSGKD